MKYRLNRTQREWFYADSTSDQDRMAFLSKGQPDIMEIFLQHSKELRYAPCIRGVPVGDGKTYTSAVEAIEAAIAIKTNIVETLGDHTIAEDALNIRDRNIDLFQRTECSEFQISKVFYSAQL